jgi:protein gp37
MEQLEMVAIAERQEREERIRRNLRNAWYETAIDYEVIRTKGLYKLSGTGLRGWMTWADYCENEWGRDRKSVDLQIQRANELSEMGKILPISDDQMPTSTSHVTALAKLEKPQQRAEVWQRVIASASGHGITAKDVEAAVAQYQASLAKNWITLEEWTAGDRWHGGPSDKTMNAQDDKNIEWAAWSWNPVTGCLHGCDYCYARDIANRFFPQEFQPSFLPERLTMPANTKQAAPRWAGDIGYRNVFTCSMADLFGKWVPQEWIEAVLQTIADNPQWTFLLLSKFPVRMAEFTYPANVWLGTTVDRQWAVERAEKAFRKIKASGFDGVCWLSCEPMLERLTFGSLEMFDWVVMGGSSRSTQTPEYRPPFDDIVHLYDQARAAGCQVYQKTNLIPGMSDEQRVREYPLTADAFSVTLESDRVQPEL